MKAEGTVGAPTCFEEEGCNSFVVFCLVESGSESDDVILLLEELLQFGVALSDVRLGFFERFLAYLRSNSIRSSFFALLLFLL
jgi:hypothetical protein